MDNNILKYLAFIKTVDKGSFTKAAEELNYAQSSVSKMVADLENEWGVTLLERGRNGLCLTSAGEQILPYARTIINDFQKMDEFVHQLKGIQTGTVRIGTFASVAINWLPDIFAEFQRYYPGIDYEMLLGDYDEIEKWIEEGRVDCGFISLPSKAKLDTIFLKNDEYKVVLPPNHKLAQNERINIKDLEGEQFLLLEHGGKTEVSELLEKSKVTPKIRFTTWEDFAIMSMVEKGLGIGILPEMILQRIPYRIEIRSLEVPYYREIGIAMKNIKRLTPATEKFMEYLKKKLLV
ncbi:MAG: LysR family transcriptional regulator [Lachnospiraceae bacterium]|nr:LysR family transcriptional regulator [Lachnospiraceae bacterium]